MMMKTIVTEFRRQDILFWEWCWQFDRYAEPFWLNVRVCQTQKLTSQLTADGKPQRKYRTYQA